MFHIGKNYRNKIGAVHKVLMHNLYGKFPIITHDEKKKLNKFTREGKFYEHKNSDLDLIEGEI